VANSGNLVDPSVNHSRPQVDVYGPKEQQKKGRQPEQRILQESKRTLRRGKNLREKAVPAREVMRLQGDGSEIEQ
jgi:hypothetical protein